MTPDDHMTVAMLLPWHVTGQLDADEHALVEAHVAHCAPCAALLAEERRLRTEILNAPLAVPAFSMPPLAEVRSSGTRDGRWRAARSTKARWSARPKRVAAFAAAQAAVVLITLQIAQPAEQPAAQFRTLSARDAANSANIVVKFNPDIREDQLRQLLLDVGASIVDGPTAAQAYLLQVDAARRDGAIMTLRQDPQILLAEAIGGE